jgi:hypothetical protein
MEISDQVNYTTFVPVTPVHVAPESWDVDRRQDGAVLVRVHSTDRNGRQLPDAVFTFRSGDPQYNYWEEKFQERTARR